MRTQIVTAEAFRSEALAATGMMTGRRFSSVSENGHQNTKIIYNSMNMNIISNSPQRGDGSVQTKNRRTTFVYISTFLLLLSASRALAADDNSTLGTVSDMLGITSNKSMEKIDYSERPKLVMPPKRDALPAPRERHQPEGWPVDADSGSRRTDRFARHPGAQPEKPKPTLLEHLHGPHHKPEQTAGAEDQSDRGILGSMINLRANRARLNEDEGPAPSRNLLSEPPDGLRTPSQDLSKVKDPDKKDSFWNFLGRPVEVISGENSPPANKSHAADQIGTSANKNERPPQSAGEEKAGFFSKVSNMIAGH